MKYDVVICDLDGTILYDWDRHYMCYCDIVKKYGGSCVSFDRYRQLKREKIKRTILLEETNFKGTYEEFANAWLESIETEYYLQFESLYNDALQVLNKWKRSGTKLYLVTMRRNREELVKQINKFGLEKLFDIIISGDPTTGVTKMDLFGDIPSGSKLVLGDTEADELFARQLQADFYMMTTGLRDPKGILAKKYFADWDELEKEV